MARLSAEPPSRRIPHFSLFRWVAILIVCLLGWPHGAAAQDTATLRVIVTSAEDGAPVPGATILLSIPDADTVAAGATNTDGYRELTRLEPGTYRLQVSFIGYAPYDEVIQLSAGTRIERVALSVGPEQLDEVVVEGERGIARRQAGLQTVTAADLRRIPTPGPGGDLASYLQTVPGVVSGGDRGGELYIRGGTPSQNLVLVDNLPIIKPFHISNLFSAFSQQSVRSVDMYAGGFGAEYMGATSSVIDVSLRQGNMQQYQGSVAVSPYIAITHIEGPITAGRESFLFVARHSLMEESASLIYGRDVPIRFYDVTGRYTLQADQATCNATGVHTYDRGQINPDRNTALSWWNLTVGGRCFLFGEAFDHAYDITAGYTQYQNSAGPVGDPERKAGIRLAYFSLDHQREFSGHSFDYGFRWLFSNHWAELDERFAQLENFNRFSSSMQGYLSTGLEVGDYLTLMPSVGVQFTTRRAEAPTVEPRFRLTFRPDGTDAQEISLAVGRYMQIAEGITDERDAGTVFTVWKPSNVEEPLPEAFHGILGYQQRLGSSFEASLEGYVKDHRYIPVSRWTPEARLTTETTLAHGMSYGVDARVELDVFPFYGFVAYGWSRVTYEAASNDLGAWLSDDGTGAEPTEHLLFRYSPPHDRRHQFNALVSYEIGGFTTSARWEFGSGLPYTRVYGFDMSLELPEQNPGTSPGTAMTLFREPFGARLPTTHRLDVSVGRSFDLSNSLALEVEAGAINLYDRSNVFYYDVNTFQRVDQTPLLPYLSFQLEIN